MVFSGLVTACRLAGCPTSRSPSSVKATIEGVVRMPSAFSITRGDLPSITATQELVVPRSMPMTLPMVYPLFHGRPVEPEKAPFTQPPKLTFAARGGVSFRLGSYRRGPLRRKDLMAFEWIRQGLSLRLARAIASPGTSPPPRSGTRLPAPQTPEQG